MNKELEQIDSKNQSSENHTSNNNQSYSSDNKKVNNQSNQNNISIQVPKGGGAIAGIGEKFQANPVTGTGNASIPIAITEGRNKFSPSLSLSYDSGEGNTAFGMGWSIGIPNISRKTQKGLPKYEDHLHSDTFILSGSEDLVPLLIENDGIWSQAIFNENNVEIRKYRPRTEGLFAQIEHHTDLVNGIDFWKVTTKDNITSIYGKSSSSKIADSHHSEKIFQWMLEYSYDEKGNIMRYEYKKENGEGISNSKINEVNRIKNADAFNQTYLKKVCYTPDIPFDPTDEQYFDNVKWKFALVLDYGEHDETSPTALETQSWPVRKDPFSSYRSGFEIRTYRLCRRFLMFHQFDAELGTDPYLVKSTTLTHDENNVATRIVAATHQSHKVTEAEAYPPVSFKYSAATIDPNIYQHSINDLENLPAGVTGNNYRWTDLHGEGLSGVLIEDQNAWYFKRNLGDANFHKDLPASAKPDPLATLGAIAPVLQRPSLAGGQIMDIDGNGTPDMVVFNGTQSGYYKRLANGEWEGFKNFEQLPNINWQDPDLRQIDLNGDGFSDLILTKEHCFICYPSLAEKGYDQAYETTLSFDEEEGPKIVFSDQDQSIYLADMSGDGMMDIIRIQNGNVCYWPNKGYGVFGAKVNMDHAPLFDFPEQFNQQRIRLTDVDGSGTTDIIYIADDCVKYYPNESGNGFGEEIIISQQLPTHNLAQIATIDLLGNGTSCLVWSSPVTGEHPPAMKYLDLMGSQKPYLLEEIDNNMGGLTRLKYAPSTKYYLRDERNGTPWITKLPFPVHVVERTEAYDLITGTRFVSKYAYHHGYFDGEEREFRGFGMVEQWDTESFSDFSDEGLFPAGQNAIEETLHAAPVYTKTWFHNGFLPHDHGADTPITDLYQREYWQGDAAAIHLAAATLPSLDQYQDLREATRALKGAVLRQEVYGLDGSDVAEVPYTVSEKSYTVVQLQPRGSERRDRDYGCYQLIEAETLAYQYERNASDPRISHQLTLETDQYGHVLKAAAVVYPRRTSIGYAQQDELRITVSENTLIHHPENDFYRLGVPIEAKSFELTGVAMPAQKMAVDALLSDFNNASTISFDTTPSSGIEKRLLSHSRIVYYDESLSATPLPFGAIASHGLPFETYQLGITATQIQHTLNEGGTTRVDNNLLTTGGYIDLLTDGNYWLPSGRTVFDATQFYLPIAQIDPLGHQASFGYDSHALLPLTTTDALGNVTAAQYDYRLLQPALITDANGNRQAFAFDVRGMVTKTAIMGKDGDNEGDTLNDPTSEFVYDLFCWQSEQKPNYAYAKMRETHQDSNTRYLESYAYSNGMGQVIMTKNKLAPVYTYQKEPDGSLSRDTQSNLIVETVTPRWLGNGRTILDNKGNPVKQYEPYFSSTSAYEDEAELVEYGVTPVIYYDPLGRAIRTELPDDTLTRVEFTPWEQKNYDQNDTVLESLWYIQNGAPDASGSQPTASTERAAWLAAQHAATPQVITLDVLGRPFQTLDDNASDGQYVMVTELDITGNPLSITDAKGRDAFAYVYNMLGQPIKTWHLDNGTRFAIGNAVGNPLRTWDDRHQAFRFEYDALHRPTKSYVTTDWDLASANETLISLTVYGESLTNAAADNLLGKPAIVFDTAGRTTMQYDFKGNPLNTTRKLALAYQQTPDWRALEGVAADAIMTNSETLLETANYTETAVYDALNRPTAMTKPDNSVMLPGYDDGGQLVTMDCQLRGAAKATTFVSAITYNERGQRKYITYGNGAHTTYHYDAKTFRLTRLITTRNTGGDILQDLNYIYDPVGNIVEQTDKVIQTHFFNNKEVSPNGKYEYDALYRLKKAEGRELIGLNAPGSSDIAISALPGDTSAIQRYTQQYHYDELGNILTMSHSATSGSWTRHYHYASDFATNKLLSTSADGEQPTLNHYQYDAHGNMEAMPHLTSMGWDFADRLQSANLGGGGGVYYTYDAGGNRTRKVVDKGNGLVHERIYLGDYEVYRERQNGTVQLERETLHLADDTGRIALVDTQTVENAATISTPAPNIRYQLSNHLGSATVELDDAAAMISYEEYHPFGSTSYRSGRNAAETSLKRYRYVGKERDEETGLYYYGARYYAAWLARFISVDPLKDEFPHLTPYQYASNDPIGAIDIDGLESTKEAEDPEYDLYAAPSGELISIPAGSTPTLDDNGVLTGFTTKEWHGGENTFTAQYSEDGSYFKGYFAKAIHPIFRFSYDYQYEETSEATASKYEQANSLIIGATSAAVVEETIEKTFGEEVTRRIERQIARRVLLSKGLYRLYQARPIAPLIFLKGDTREKGFTAEGPVAEVESDSEEEKFTTIYKAPQPGMGQKLLLEGFQKEDFPRNESDDSNGIAYFAGPKSRALAEDYARIYGEGVLEVSIPDKVYKKVFKPLERRYLPGTHTEVLIPYELFDILNANPRTLKQY